MARNIMHRLDPSNIVSPPNRNVPNVLPKLLIEPIQDSCSFVMGPVVSGVSFDKSVGNAGETHPTQAPWLKITMFAGPKENIVGRHNIW